MNMTRNFPKLYRILSLAFILALSFAVTVIALANTSSQGVTITANQADYRLDTILAEARTSISPNASVGECMVARFNDLIGAKKDSLNCTSNDVSLASYEILSGPEYCEIDELINVSSEANLYRHLTNAGMSGFSCPPMVEPLMP
jgi:hypothetical protein